MKEYRVTAMGNRADAVYFGTMEKALGYVEKALKATDGKMRLLIEQYTSHYDNWFRWYVVYDSAGKGDNGRF